MAVTKVEATTKFRHVGFLLTFVLGTGTIGFHLIEDWTLLDSFFMTLITITTIGYREIQPLSDVGKMFDMAIIFMGVGSSAYGLAAVAQFVVEGEVQKIMGRRKLDKKITLMNNHYIICGNGRIGSLISHDLAAAGKDFVVIDMNPETMLALDRTDILHILGDATEDEILVKAGIKRAKGLIATASSDVTNVYITLIARELNPDIFILARAETEDSIRNLKRAGADKVISPYLVGGRHMANIILKPTVVDFVELATGEKRDDFYIEMEGFKIRSGSCLIEKTLKDAPIRKDLGLIVVAIKNSAGNMTFNPPADYCLSQGDVLICMGDPKALDSMQRLVAGRS